MASSSSFINSNGQYVKNSACFSSFFPTGKEIVVEDDKLVFGKQEFIDYLEELKKIIAFEYVYETRTLLPYISFNNRNSEPIEVTGFFITLQKGLKKAISLFCTTVFRFYWEGKYLNCDPQYIIYENFMKICALFPQNNRLELLCVAHNIFRNDLYVGYNEHLLSPAKCEIVSELNMNAATLFEMFFKGSSYISDPVETIPANFKNIRDYSKEQYVELLKYFNIEIVE